MDEFEFAFEGENGEMLIRREIEHTEQLNVVKVTKIPVINEQVFKMCYEKWIKPSLGDDGK